MPIQQCWVCAHLQQEAHHLRLPRDHCQVQGRLGEAGRVSQAAPCLTHLTSNPSPSPIEAPHLVQVIGDINHAEVWGVVDDVGYLLNDGGLPVDDGQVQWPRD